MNAAPIFAPSQSATDPELLDACLRGRRDAFGLLVTRYQGLLCAQAYAICGDFGRSEDVAQEAFVSAWGQLRELRDHAKFKSWLCGIARYLALRVVNRRDRDHASAPVEGSSCEEATPHELAVSREEESIVWNAMQELPESYRGVLTLFYREGQSVAAVAQALDLTDDAVKQRLARGRAMLRTQVAAVVEETLQRSRPGPAFTLAVLALIGAAAPPSATAATLLAAAKSGAPLKAALGLAPFFGLLGGVVGVFGGWFGMKAAAEAAQYERERAALRRMARRVWLGVVGFTGIMIVSAVLVRALWKAQMRGERTFLSAHPASLPLIVFGLVVVYHAWILWEILRGKREISRIRTEELAAGTPVREPAGMWRYLAFRGPLEYRSARTLFGWPLVHVLWPDPTVKAPLRRDARGWIAIGDAPIGLLAVGGMARGGIALGGVAIGIISFGGVAVGPVAIGGGALAIWAYGGAAAGWIAQGGIAIAWHAAMGGYALARDAAVGGYSTALQANTGPADALVMQSAWLRVTSLPWIPCLVPLVVIVMLAALGLIAAKLRRKHSVKA